MGWVLSIFALGYALFQTPSGMLADKYGARKVLSSIVAIWSLFTALTGAAWNYISLLVVRFLFGAGEAGAFPSISSSVYNWIPLKERGIVNGINFSGSRIGAAFALPLVALMIELLNWRVTFFVLGGIGFVWAIFWYYWFRDRPSEHKTISNEEREYIEANLQSSVQEKSEIEDEKLKLDSLLKSKNMWLAMWQYFCSNFTFFFTLTWLFPYIKSTYNINAVETGLWTSIPLLFGALGNWFSGWLVDRIYRNGKWEASRKIPAGIGFALAAIGLMGSVYMTDIVGAIIFLSIAIFGADMTLSPSWSFCIDIGKKHSGAVSGTMNMAGNIGAFITALAFPYLREWSGDVTLFFYVGAVLNVIAILTWLAMKPRKSLYEY
jgi:ACS family glucarate transporter-like MFS transporter